MSASAWSVLQAVRGPVMLVTFGSLMALSHTETLGFGQTWPVLIIVYGVFKLLERMVARPMPIPPPWPGPPPVVPAGTYVPPQYPPPQSPPAYPPQQPQGGGQ